MTYDEASQRALVLVETHSEQKRLWLWYAKRTVELESDEI